jgi:hypothetical protein
MNKTMKTIKLKLLLLVLASAFSLQPSALHAQGSLTPSGTPAPTMKSLDQIEARIIVNAANTPGNSTNTFIINAPGSYYLTGNITGASGKHGISIQTNDVTLDLNGFSIISGGGGAFRGINVLGVQKNFCIRNGTVRGWTDGGVRTDLATSTLAEKLRLSDNVGATGLALGNGAAKDCVATGNATGFVIGNGAQIKDSAASANIIGFSASDRSHINNCISTVNTGDGFNCTSYVNLMDCTSSRNGGNGIVTLAGCSILRCNVSKNIPFGYGIQAGTGCMVADCAVDSNGLDGIDVDSGSTIRNCAAYGNTSRGIVGNNGACRIVGNHCDANGDNGILVQGSSSGDKNRVEGNSCTLNGSTGFVINGIHNLVICNSASGNIAAYAIPANNAPGPIVDMTGGGTISSTSPWANFSY